MTMYTITMHTALKRITIDTKITDTQNNKTLSKNIGFCGQVCYSKSMGLTHTFLIQ